MFYIRLIASTKKIPLVDTQKINKMESKCATKNLELQIKTARVKNRTSKYKLSENNEHNGSSKYLPVNNYFKYSQFLTKRHEIVKWIRKKKIQLFDTNKRYTLVLRTHTR
jgi:hypothetical protein